jgi:hypothetical protein
VTRLTSDLARAVSLHRLPPQTADVDKLVEQAIALARHRIGEDSELSIDLGDVPPVRIVPGELVLLLARLLTAAADAARGASGGGIAIAIRRERDAGGAPGRDTVLIQIGAVAGGATTAPEAEAAELEALASRVLEPAGGALAIGGDAHFEIRLVVAR